MFVLFFVFCLGLEGLGLAPWVYVSIRSGSWYSLSLAGLCDLFRLSHRPGDPWDYRSSLVSSLDHLLDSGCRMQMTSSLSMVDLDMSGCPGGCPEFGYGHRPGYWVQVYPGCRGLGIGIVRRNSPGSLSQRWWLCILGVVLVIRFPSLWVVLWVFSWFIEFCGALC